MTAATPPPSTGPASQGEAVSETTAMLRDAKRRRTRILGGIAVVAVLLGGALWAAFASMQRDKEHRLAEAYGALSRCLWGDVMAEGQTPGVRVRAGQLFTMAVPEHKRAEAGGTPWPMRCASYAFGVKERLADTGRAGGDGRALAEAADELGRALKDPKSVSAPIAPIVERVWEEASRIKLASTQPAEGVPAPPSGPAPLTADALARAKPIVAKPVPGNSIVAETMVDAELRLLFREAEGAPLLCTFGAAASSCRALPEAVRPAAAALRVVGTVEDGAAPLVVGERNGAGGVFRSDTGERLGGYPVFGAHAKKDGTLTAVSFDEEKERLLVVRYAPGAAPKEERVDPNGNTGNGYYNLALLWDQLVWKAVTKDDQLHVFARKLEAGGDGSLVGPAADLGQINEPSRVENKEDEEPHVTGCRTSEALVARVKGWVSQFLVFQTAGQWSFPVRVAGRGGLLTCRGAEATLTRIDERIAGGGGRVSQFRCTAAGCKAASAKGQDLVGAVRELAPADAAQTAAADLDGKLLFVWVAGGDGGLRMRLAPIESVGQAADVVLYDPLVKDGKVGTTSTLYDLKLYVRDSAALLVLSTASGVHVIRIEADGTFAPVARAG